MVVAHVELMKGARSLDAMQRSDAIVLHRQKAQLRQLI